MIASFSGDSVLKALKLMKGTGIEMICVSSAAGNTYAVKDLEKWASFNEVPSLRKMLEEWKRKGVKEIPASLPPETAEELRKKGVKVV